ncbi:MAG: hypothetical protein Q9227_007774 [Pyrenula ochraceoflavens]
MQLLPTISIQKILSRPKQDHPSLAGLPPSEREAAIYKLEDVHPTYDRRRIFNWKTFGMAFLSLLLVTAIALASVALAVDKDSNPDLVAKLKMANTALDRLALLPKDEDWLFDFTKQSKYTFSPGGVVNANAATFPATVGQGLTMAMLNLGPCAQLPPHLHPRASNYVVSITGTTNTYMVMENGARTVRETLSPGKMTIFPQGSIHTMQNTGCGNAQLVSALRDEDTGTTNLLNTLFGGGLPGDVVMAAMGQQGGDGGNLTMKGMGEGVPGVGTGSNLGSEECRRRCGI